MPRLTPGHITVESGKILSAYPYTNQDGTVGEHLATIAEYVGKPQLNFSESVLHP
jgi:hypothetical protein